jgi:hypothetical protein
MNGGLETKGTAPDLTPTAPELASQDAKSSAERDSRRVLSHDIGLLHLVGIPNDLQL